MFSWRASFLDLLCQGCPLLVCYYFGTADWQWSPWKCQLFGRWRSRLPVPFEGSLFVFPTFANFTNFFIFVYPEFWKVPLLFIRCYFQLNILDHLFASSIFCLFLNFGFTIWLFTTSCKLVFTFQPSYVSFLSFWWTSFKLYAFRPSFLSLGG